MERMPSPCPSWVSEQTHICMFLRMAQPMKAWIS